MLGGYTKMVENWTGFQAKFQIEYLFGHTICETYSLIFKIFTRLRIGHLELCSYLKINKVIPS
jgi:hypothetical protein